MFFSSPADAQRRKAPSSAATSEAKPKKKKAAKAAPAAPAAAEVAEAPAAPVPAEPEPAPAAPAPVAQEPAPMPAPVPAPPPAVSKRPRQSAAAGAAMADDTTTTDLGPPPQRSIRKKAMRNAVSSDVDEDDDGQPIRRHKTTSRSLDDDDEGSTRSDSSSDRGDDESESDKEASSEPESDVDTDTDSAANKARRPKPFLIDVTAALRGFQRHFSYTDDPFNELPNYDLGGAPAIALEAAIYPFKNAKGTLSGGFTGSFEYAVGIGTTYKVPTGSQEGTHGTSAYGYTLGVRGNYAFGSTLSNIASAGVEFGAQSFVIDHPPPVRGNANIPSVEYKFIRPNLQGRFPLMDRLAVLASAGYLMVSSAGEIVSEDYFRGATSSASGLDVGIGAAYELRTSGKGTFKFLELRPMLTFRRYSFKFNPADTDPYIASGATDDYIGLNLGIATRM